VMARDPLKLASCAVVLLGLAAPWSRAAGPGAAGDTPYAAEQHQGHTMAGASEYVRAETAERAGPIKRSNPMTRGQSAGDPAPTAARRMAAFPDRGHTPPGVTAKIAKAHPYALPRASNGTGLAQRSKMETRSGQLSSGPVAAPGLPGSTDEARLGRGLSTAPTSLRTMAASRSVTGNGLGGAQKSARYAVGTSPANKGMLASGGIAGNTVHRKY
jgi:hypothetical protein